MTTTDPTTILREAIRGIDVDVYRAGMINTVPLGATTIIRIFASRIPQACQTCKGSGVECVKAYSDGVPMIERPCPDCPTIATLLLWGWNVAKAKRTIHHNGYADSISHAQGWNACLAALREVMP